MKFMKEDLVQVTEIWRPVEKGGEAYTDGKNFKLVAYLAGGKVIHLEDACFCEVRHISQEEFINLNL